MKNKSLHVQVLKNFDCIMPRDLFVFYLVLTDFIFKLLVNLISPETEAVPWKWAVGTALDYVFLCANEGRVLKTKHILVFSLCKVGHLSAIRSDKKDYHKFHITVYMTVYKSITNR